MLDKKDYYELLGITNKNITDDEIKRTCRKLSRKFHLDYHSDKFVSRRSKRGCLTNQCGTTNQQPGGIIEKIDRVET